MPSDDVLSFFATPGPMTDLGGHERSLADAPTAPAAIAAFVQGLLIHPHWAMAYDVNDADERQHELQARGAAAILDGVLARDPRPLGEPRDPAGRFLGNCRDFSALTTALLRRAGTAARARCGFAGYFEPDGWVDHWIVEVWTGDRWAMLDAQLDAFQREVTGVVDATDLPAGSFLTAGDAWQRTRAGEHDPDVFGIMDLRGAWFISSNVGRDMAAMNKIEMLPWDDWGSLADIQARYRGDPSLQVGAEVTSMIGPGEWGPSAVVELA
ncbi:MAG: transglutaminase domain-containing protein [Actinomycetota bacterium]